MSFERATATEMWDNRSGPEGAVNTIRGLIHSLDLTKEGLGMKPTRKLPSTTSTQSMEALDQLVKLTQKFWSKVEKSDSCWLWMGTINQNGYGRFSIKSRLRSAHRVAWALTQGEVPKGMQLDHLCRNRACVNPDHLEPVSPAENVHRGLATFELLGKCISGRHPIVSPSDYYTYPSGKRECMKCRAERREGAKNRARRALK